MFWRIVHDTLKWLWPALFAGIASLGGIAVAAAQVWPEAKTAVGKLFATGIVMLTAPSTWCALAVLIVAWLALFIWTGHKMAGSKGWQEPVPDTPLHHAIRYIARDTAWAAAYPSEADGRWIIRADTELISALRGGRLTAFGEHWPAKGQRQRHSSQIPQDYFAYVQWHSERMVTKNAPTHFWRDAEHGGGMYLWVRLSRDQLEAVWRRRSLLHRLARRSPFERWLRESGSLGAECIREQDYIYRQLLLERT